MYIFLGGSLVFGAIPITQAPYLVTIDLDNQTVFDGTLVAPNKVLVAGTSITWQVFAKHYVQILKRAVSVGLV